MLELDWSAHLHVVMWWNFRSKSMRMERLLTLNLKPLVVAAQLVSHESEKLLKFYLIVFILHSIELTCIWVGQGKDFGRGWNIEEHRYRKRALSAASEAALLKWVDLDLTCLICLTISYSYSTVLAEDAIKAALADYKKKQIKEASN